MKPIIFPLATLVAMGCWHLVNNHKIANLKESLDSKDSVSAPVQPKPVNKEKAFIGQGGDFELAKFGDFLTKVLQGEIKSKGGNAWLWTEQQLSLMNADSLIDLLHELEDANFPPQEQSRMAYEIRDALRKVSPQKYLQLVGIRSGSNHVNSANAFKKLIESDPSSAISWFDDYVEKTKLGEKEASPISSARVAFEKIIASQLYPDQMDALEKRFSNMHEDQIVRVLGSLVPYSSPKLSHHYLDLVRGSVSEESAKRIIVTAVMNIARNKELPEVAEIVSEHPLTASEKVVFYKAFAGNFAWKSGGRLEKFETILPFMREQGIESSDEIYATGIVQIYRDELRGTGDLTKIYRYVQETGESQNLGELLPAFVNQTTSRVCECCSLKGRLSRISDENLKSQISTAYQRNLDSVK